MDAPKKERGKSNVFKKWFSKSKRDRSSTSDLTEVEDGGSSEQYIHEGTQRALALSQATCEYMPSLSTEELEAIPLPGALVAEEYHLSRSHANALMEFNSRLPEIQQLIEDARIAAESAEMAGENLSKFKKKTKTRGDARLYTKVDKEGRRVVLQWNDNGQPFGPGDWSTKFTEVIGCLVRNIEVWNVAFSFKKNSYNAYKTTWIEILRYFYLEDEIDRRWVYVRDAMHQKFKQYRERIKRKYVKTSLYEADWQRIYGLPSTIPIQSFAYLLLDWSSERGKAESERNKANRLKSVESYFGGSVSTQRYRHTIDMAGGDASMSTTWQVLHTRDDMPEDIMQVQRRHWEHLVAGEQSFREENPDYPTAQSILPLEVESRILQQEFPAAAAKGRVPIVGPRSSASSRGSSSAGGGYNYFHNSEEFQRIQQSLEAEWEKRQKLEEECQSLRQGQLQMQEQQQRMEDAMRRMEERLSRQTASQPSLWQILSQATPEFVSSTFPQLSQNMTYEDYARILNSQGPSGGGS